jgi:hypothetical protein
MALLGAAIQTAGLAEGRYVALSLPSLEELGLGSRLDRLGGRRGRVRVTQVEAIDPFAGRSESAYGGDQLEVIRPLIRIAEEAVVNRAEQLHTNRLTLRFLTPARLVGGGRLLYRPEFQPLILRLVERLHECSHRQLCQLPMKEPQSIHCNLHQNFTELPPSQPILP